MSVEINVRYDGGLKCTAEHVPSRAAFETEAPVDNGGKGTKFSPTDLVGAAFGTCVMTIMGLIAGHSGIDLKGTTVRVVKEMASHPARRIGGLTATITFPKGLEISDADRMKFERTIETCPVRQSLHPDVKVEAKFVYPS